MRWLKLSLGVAVAVVMTSGPATAQTSTGTITGRVVDTQGGTLPGVTITITSPNLQGTRSDVSSQNGDYILTLLPPGTYEVTFELSGFGTIKQSVSVAPTQNVPINVTMGPAPISEVVNVIGDAAAIVTKTAQLTTNFKQDFISTLPSTRNLDASILMAPALHPTGPAGAYSVAGSMSFESLFTVNGVVVNENLRGQPNALYIEDAIQEVAISTAGVSAEFGRFGGGMINAITKSGGNVFSGSFRTSFNNDNWRTVTPFKETKLDKTVPTYEFTFGGPIVRDHLWFFGAGRMQSQESTRSTNATNLSYVRTLDEKRYEGKLTYSPNSKHSFKGSFTKIQDDRLNDSGFNFAALMDLASLTNRSIPQDLLSLNYTGILTPNFFVEAQYAARHSTTPGSGSTSTDLINGTLVTDRARGTRYWSPTFCGVCDDEKRDNNDIRLKGTYFLSTKNAGAHDVVFGYDVFNDMRFANNHQSGSDYRILGTRTILQGTTVFPVFLGDNSTRLQWNPIELSSLGTNFRTHSLFINDSWRHSRTLTFNLGLRWDKNDGKDASGASVAKDSLISPRFAAVWDPAGDGRWTVSGSFARYAAAISNSVADLSPAGLPQTSIRAYQGPSINADPNGTLIPTDVAIGRVFDWFRASGGINLFNRPITLLGVEGDDVPGVSLKIPDTLKSPNSYEYAGAVSRQMGSRGSFRVDGVFRRYQDFYSDRTDLSTGRVTSTLGQTFDLTVRENTDDLLRRYAGLTTQASYRFNGVDVGGNYTLSRTWGNIDGENSGSGPIAAFVKQYPEYRQASWNYPIGDLSIDQRHRVRLWGTYTPPLSAHAGSFNVSALEQIGSGVPYGAVGPVNSATFVKNPGYLNPQGGRSDLAWDYFFSARDAYATAATYRTDLALNYSYRIPGTRSADMFIHTEIINLFNQFQLCGCGGSVFSNGGATSLTNIGQSVLTSSNSGTVQAFNPFTTAPVEGVNWNKGANFGTALNQFAYTTPRTFRFNLGVRF
jgi:carboxypeptidase family protein